MSAISVNGKTYSGNSIIVSNGRVVVNGVDVTPDSKEISITVTGNITELRADACNTIRVYGNTGSIHTQSGDVEASGDVSGSVQTMSGSVECGHVGGSISTMSGNVKHRKP